MPSPQQEMTAAPSVSLLLILSCTRILLYSFNNTAVVTSLTVSLVHKEWVNDKEKMSVF